MIRECVHPPIQLLEFLRGSETTPHTIAAVLGTCVTVLTIYGITKVVATHCNSTAPASITTILTLRIAEYIPSL